MHESKKGMITSHVLYFDSYTFPVTWIFFFPKVEPGTEILKEVETNAQGPNQTKVFVPSDWTTSFPS